MNFESLLIEVIDRKNHEELIEFIGNHRSDFFSLPSIKTYYDLLKPISFADDESMLTIAWMALLSGDNMKVYTYAESINEDNISYMSKAFFYQLKALSGIFGSTDERMVYSEKSLKMFEKNDTSFYHANAYLTHGQILVGFQRIREGADAFFKAYQIFMQNEKLFPASVAMTNALLNWFRLGEFSKLLKKGEQALLIASSFKESEHLYWNVISLPIGMCYVEQYKLNIALEHLKKAYDAIAKMNLIHMHGYVEIYLIKAYHLLKDKDNLSKVIEEAQKTFANMHYAMMQLIILYGKILRDGDLAEADIERLETIYTQDDKLQPLLIEMMCALYQKNMSMILDIETIEAYIQKSRYEGDLVNLSNQLLCLADRYYKDDELHKCEAILEEVIELYHKKNLKANFYMYDYSLWPMIHKMDPTIKSLDENETLLTNKEKDVMELIVQGKTNQEIAKILFISIGTVKWHINHIFSKLYAKNRIEAIEIAKQKKII